MLALIAFVDFLVSLGHLLSLPLFKYSPPSILYCWKQKKVSARFRAETFFLYTGVLQFCIVDFIFNHAFAFDRFVDGSRIPPLNENRKNQKVDSHAGTSFRAYES